MRALVVSDIHGNAAALDAVLAVPHDLVISLGDLVGYGPAPAECVARIRDEATLAVRGNHDHAFASHVDPRASARFKRLAAATAAIADGELDEADRRWLAGRPTWDEAEVDGVRVVGLHATPRDPLYEYLGPESEAWADCTKAVDADLILVGHTHLPFRIDLEGRTIVNPGSVGMPKDGDARAAYALIDDGIVTLERVEYDIEETVARMWASPAPPDSVAEFTRLIRTGRVPDLESAA